VGSLLAGWRVSLRRTRADWPIVAAAFLITLLAAVLLSGGPIYSAAASEAGLRRALADASVADVKIEVSRYGASAGAAAEDGRVQAELQQVIASLGGSIVRDWRGSETLALPGPPQGEAGDQAILGFLDGLPGHATLVGGAWPADSQSPSEPMQVVVADAVAQQLHLGVGDQLSLLAHGATQPVVVRARLVGIFAIDVVGDPYWNADQQLLTGVAPNASHQFFGPFLTTPHDLLWQAGVAALHMQWRIFLNFERLTVDDIAELRSRVEALSGRLQSVTGDAFDVVTGLPSILRDAERSLLVSRTGVLLLIAQLAILGAYAIILTASLLVDHRRIDTALLRSRGAGPPQVALLAVAEGLLLAIPAVLMAPWLAVAALNLLNVVGPLADVSLRIAPRVTLDGYLAAGAAGIVCVALLVLPAVLAARGFAAEQGELSRQETRTFGQRMGLDVALLAVTGIALWQLRLYGAPLTRTVQGSLGLDPLLVAAPAIGLVAGGVLALRILPLLAEGVESVVSRGRALVGSLGSRQMARRPLRYTRSALLLMLAVSMGVFALSYAATWSTSQREQAEYQSGADFRVRPADSPTALPAWSLPSRYAGLPGIGRASAVERITDGISFAGAGSADLLALDADTAAGIVLLRGDESARPLGEMMLALRGGRPQPRLLTLPSGAVYLRIVPRLDFASISQFDPITGEVVSTQLDPAALVGLRLSASAIVRDADGLLYRVESGLVPMDGPATALVLPLKLDGPVELAGLGVDLWLPQDVSVTDGLIGVAAVLAGFHPAGPWTAVPVDSRGAWSAKMAEGLRVFNDVPADQTQGLAVRLGADQNGGIFGGFGGSGPSAQLLFLPASVAASDAPVPVIANRAFLASTASAEGATISATVEGAARTLLISGVVDSFPTTDPGRPLVVLDERTLGLLRLQGTGGTRSADEWWMSAADGHVAALTSALRHSPFDSAEVVSVVDRTRSLSTDPVALGIIGALSLGFVATGLFAVVGLTVSAAVSARQRRTEFALLRALGLSGRQLAGSLWLENGSLVLVSLLAGTSLGLLIAWLVLPFATVTQRATAPVPPVIVQVPWDRILVLDVVSALALGVAVVVIGAVLRRLGVGSVLRMGED
jgi:ABC-type lipoprotein release transport system permease subunit